MAGPCCIIPKKVRPKGVKFKEQIKRQEERINELEEKLNTVSMEEIERHVDSHILHRVEGYEAFGGLRIGAGSTFVVQGTHKANGDSLSSKGEDATDGSYSVDLELEKEFKDTGKVFLHLETGDGEGVEDELKVFSNVNRDADDQDNSIKVTEAWYEHNFDILGARLMVGKIDGTILVDTNEYANDETTQFLGRIFRNSPAIEFADNGGGFRLALEPADLVDMQVLLMDADSDWEDIADDIFFATQLNLKPNLFDRVGNYRLVGWMNSRDHTKWNDSTQAKERGFGFGISFDQEICDTMGAFLRYGWQDPDVYINGQSFSLEHAWSAGLNIRGELWSRKDDELGIAVGQAMPSGKYKDAGTNLAAESEGHFETYYNYNVNEHLKVIPDVQVIWNPYGDDATNGKSTITVVGMRGQLDF